MLGMGTTKFCCLLSFSRHNCFMLLNSEGHVGTCGSSPPPKIITPFVPCKDGVFFTMIFCHIKVRQLLQMPRRPVFFLQYINATNKYLIAVRDFFQHRISADERPQGFLFSYFIHYYFTTSTSGYASISRYYNTLLLRFISFPS